MRSVRCDVCGTKALMAASQCPKCSHLFEVRDGFGELLPLAFCSSCDSYYPTSVGECKWCGTKPEPAPKAPYIWKSVGAGALVVLAGLGFFMRDSRPKRDAIPAPKAQARAEPELTYVSDTIAHTTMLAGDTNVVRVTTASSGNVEPTAPAPEPARVVASEPVIPQAAPQPIGAPSIATRPSTKVSTPLSPKARMSSRWVNSVARSWVVVRSDARRDARIVASIGPDSRVQLGESRGGWRRIKSRGISGWVDEGRSSFAAIRTSNRAGALAVR